jgi:hypothetical protein
VNGNRLFLVRNSSPSSGGDATPRGDLRWLAPEDHPCTVAALAVAAAALVLGTAAPAGAVVRVQRVAPDIAPREQWRVRTNPGTAALTYVLREKIKSGSDFVEGCLDLVGDVAQPGKGIAVRPCDGTNSQKWLDVNTLSGGAVFEFENKVGYMKLNVFHAAVGGIAAQQGVVSSAEQKFRRLPL